MHDLHTYLALKSIHVTCAAISVTFFVVRARWAIAESRLLHQRWVKTTPHVVDSLLLLSAIGLAISSHQYPLYHSWLTAKVVGLVFYIGFGTMVIKRARSRRARIVFLTLALITFSYIVLVAVSKSVLPPLVVTSTAE